MDVVKDEAGCDYCPSYGYGYELIVHSLDSVTPIFSAISKAIGSDL